MLQIGQKAIQKHNNLKKVILLEHSPRFDTKTNTKLAELGNQKLKQLLDESPLKDRMVIGHHSLGSYGIGKTFDKRYRNSLTGCFDGVHFYGPCGGRDYTKSLISILSTNLKDMTMSSKTSTSNQGN